MKNLRLLTNSTMSQRRCGSADGGLRIYDVELKLLGGISCCERPLWFVCQYCLPRLLFLQRQHKLRCVLALWAWCTATYTDVSLNLVTVRKLRSSAWPSRTRICFLKQARDMALIHRSYLLI